MRLFVCDDKVITFWTCNGPPVPWPVGRAVLGALEAPVLMVGTDPVVVEERLRSGMLRCPGCGDDGLAPWGHARSRSVRHRDGRVEALRPQRGRCGSCRGTHVLLPVTCLLRRVDAVEVIGAALLAKAAGPGTGRSRRRLGRPATTVRDWLRRFAALAEAVAGAVHRAGPAAGPGLDPPPRSGSGFADAVAAIGVAAARRRWCDAAVVGGRVAVAAGRGGHGGAGCSSGGRFDQHEFALGGRRAERTASASDAPFAEPREALGDRAPHRRSGAGNGPGRSGCSATGLIREAADPALSTRQRGRLVRRVAAAEHVGPFGAPVRVSRATVDRWIRAWRAGGFDALVPPRAGSQPAPRPRSWSWRSRSNGRRPARTAAQITAVLRTASGWAPHERTVQRHFVRLGLTARPDGTPTAGVRPVRSGRGQRVVDRRRPARPAPGRPQGDPVRLHRRSFSRALVGYRWAHREDTVRLEAALRAGLAARGVPQRIYVDNGSAFVIQPAAARLRDARRQLTHSKPRPARKAVARSNGSSAPCASSSSSNSSTAPRRQPVTSLDELNQSVHGLGRDRLPPPRALRDRADPAGPARRRPPTGPAHPGPAARGVPVVRAPHRHQDRDVSACTATSTSSTPRSSAAGSSSCSTRSTWPTSTSATTGASMGAGVPHRIDRHVHPHAAVEPPPPPAPTGIDYLALVEPPTPPNSPAHRLPNSSATSTTTPNDVPRHHRRAVLDAVAGRFAALLHHDGELPGQLDLTDLTATPPTPRRRRERAS